ncbi:hypothetical protein, partial [Bradyrhizobium sp. 35]|uniref:hypothetical protein n=1 Tax=Bradyrhizobium sp. 35 TaxID=2782670 RepID=UPI001FF71F4F
APALRVQATPAYQAGVACRHLGRTRVIGCRQILRQRSLRNSLYRTTWMAKTSAPFRARGFASGISARVKSLSLMAFVPASAA